MVYKFTTQNNLHKIFAFCKKNRASHYSMQRSHQQWRQPPANDAYVNRLSCTQLKPVCTEHLRNVPRQILHSLFPFYSCNKKKKRGLSYISSFSLSLLNPPETRRQDLFKITVRISFFERHMLCIFRALILGLR